MTTLSLAMYIGFVGKTFPTIIFLKKYKKTSTSSKSESPQTIYCISFVGPMTGGTVSPACRRGTVICPR